MSIRFVLSALAVAGALFANGQQPPSLKDAYENSFLIGAAINERVFSEQDARDAAIVKAQFNSITPENVLKWEAVHPQPDKYNFGPADQFVAFGEKNHMFLVGHTLIWHNQTPKWVFQDDKGQPLTREQLLARMREHIQTVVGRYKGKISGWDVVNEALDEDGTLRQTPWMKIIGADYIEKAFQFAHEADPKAELYYNDYSLENEAKREGAVDLIRRLRERGVPVTGVGIQGHDNLDWPTVEQEDATIAAFAQLGVKVMITELDIDVLPAATRSGSADVSVNLAPRPELNPYVAGLPPSVQEKLAKRYADLFRVFLKHQRAVERVTFWGVTDSTSWKNNWPIRGRTNYPLLFDRNGNAKPAFQAVIRAAD
jgi:endo-1,4-beta-xylanase